MGFPAEWDFVTSGQRSYLRSDSRKSVKDDVLWPFAAGSAIITDNMADQTTILRELRDTLNGFEEIKPGEDVRERVLALVPAVETLRKIGKNVIPDGLKLSARNRLLTYFRMYPLTVLNEKELAVVAGISEWARRVRELRVQSGWKIISGVTAKEMLSEEDIERSDIDLGSMGPDDYALLATEQDRDAAHRWHLANQVRKQKGGMKDRILDYLRGNVSKEVTGEELRYVAKGSEWARRVRELRTEDGFPISTKMSGNPHLGVGVYVLEQDRQTPKHDRSIPDPLRREVLRRDQYECTSCGWSHIDWNRSDPRFLEIHHVQHHARGGRSEQENLITLCNVCHDEVHRMDR
jgi:hypothetical protein